MGSRYEEIADTIRRRIEAGEWEPESRLPVIDVLAEEFGAARNTVHRAIGLLETMGYVSATRGSGVVVRYGAIRARRPRGNLVKRNLWLRGYSFPSASAGEQWTKHGEADNTPTEVTDERIARLLGVKVGDVVPRRWRVTGPIGEAPFQINISWIHPRVAEMVANVDKNPAAGEWLYQIEVGGHWPLKWFEFIRARNADPVEAKALGIRVGKAVMEYTRQGWSGKDEKPVEVTQYIIDGDRVESVQVLERDESAKPPWPDVTEAES